MTREWLSSCGIQYHYREIIALLGEHQGGPGRAAGGISAAAPCRPDPGFGALSARGMGYL